MHPAARSKRANIVRRPAQTCPPDRRVRPLRPNRRDRRKDRPIEFQRSLISVSASVLTMTTDSHWFLRARIKTRQLLLLQVLAEEGNIHRAAQELNMTQPAASKLLKNLEDVLGVQLFDRLPRGMRPTWYGESMIRHARMVLANLSQAYDEVEALKAGRFGQVSVGAITAPGMTLLPPAIAVVKQEHPSLRVSLQIETSDVLMERLH